MNIADSAIATYASGRGGFGDSHGGIDDRPIELTGSNEAIDFRYYWLILLKNRVSIAVFALVGLLAGIAVTLVMTPVYRATTTIQVAREATKVLDVQDVQPVEEAQEAERFLQTQVDLLESRSLAIRVAENLGFFARSAAFFDEMHTKLDDSDMSPVEARVTRRDKVIQLLQRNLDTEWSRNSRIVKVSFNSPNAALAARIVNAFAENYISGNLDRRFESSSYARDFVERRLGQTKAKLEDSERQMIAYARREQLIDASDGDQQDRPRGPRSLTAANLVELNTAYSAARANRIQNEERWRQSRSNVLFSLPEVLQNLTIQELLQRRAGLRADYEDRRKVFKDDYPTMRQLSAQIAELDSQIAREAANIRSAIGTQYQIALKQEQALLGDVDRLKAQTLNEQGRSIQYNILKREADTNRVLYDALLQRYKEISLSGGVTANNISVVDQAEAPIKPTRPRPLLNAALALLLGFMLGIGAALLRDKFDDTARTPDDLKSKLGLALIGVVPVLRKSDTPAEALSDVRSEMSEAYSSIRASLQFATNRGVPSPLLVTSSQQSEGKSTTSIAIAMSFSRIGKRVLLIDGDMRRPSLHNALHLGKEKGLSNLLAGQMSLKDVAQQTDYPGLSFVASGPLPLDPSELLAGPGLPAVLQDAEAAYDLVIVDGPPVMGLADAPLFASQVGGVVFVIEAGRTHRGQSKVSLARLREAHAPMVGAILSKFDRKSTAYGTDYAYAYTYNYGSKTSTS